MEKEVLDFIKKNNLTSFMNNTKWKEMVREITSNAQFNPSVNIKYLFDDNNNGRFAPVWWNEVERDGFELIEWVKIASIKKEYIGRLIEPKQTDFSEFIFNGLTKHHIPFVFEKPIFTIYGYK